MRFAAHRLAVGRHRIGAALVAVTVLAAGGVARADQSLSRAQLAELAERAALAGAGALAADPQTDADDMTRAAQAAERVLATHPDVQARVATAADQKRVTVTLSARGPGRYGIGGGGKPIEAAATAHYRPPDRLAHWAWASHPRFAMTAQHGWRVAQHPTE
jgi:hypothetical protein